MKVLTRKLPTNRRVSAHPHPDLVEAVTVSRFWRNVSVGNDDDQIRERRAAGARQLDLANDFGVTNGLVSMIVRGKRWAHVGGPIQTERQHNGR